MVLDKTPYLQPFLSYKLDLHPNMLDVEYMIYKLSMASLVYT